MKPLFRHFLLVLVVAVLAGACKQDDPVAPVLRVPDSYAAFEGVDLSGPQEQLAMLSELSAYAKTAHDGISLDSTRLAAMYTNESGAGFRGSYGSSLQETTNPQVAQSMFDHIDRLAHASSLGLSSTPNQAGIHVAPSNGKSYLLDDNGVEYLQVIEKGLMGASLYYQAAEIHLQGVIRNPGSNGTTSNSTSAAQAAFDQALAYLGVPLDYPTDIDGIAFWGKYCNDRDPVIGTNAIIESFLRGRAAATQDIPDSQAESAARVIGQWERVAIGSAIHYLNQALSHVDDYARRAHDLTEAVAFLKSTANSSIASLDKATIQRYLEDCVGSSDWQEMDLWDVTDDQILSLRSELAQRFSMQDVSEQL